MTIRAARPTPATLVHKHCDLEKYFAHVLGLLVVFAMCTSRGAAVLLRSNVSLHNRMFDHWACSGVHTRLAHSVASLRSDVRES